MMTCRPGKGMWDMSPGQLAPATPGGRSCPPGSRGLPGLPNKWPALLGRGHAFLNSGSPVPNSFRAEWVLSLLREGIGIMFRTLQEEHCLKKSARGERREAEGTGHVGTWRVARGRVSGILPVPARPSSSGCPGHG